MDVKLDSEVLQQHLLRHGPILSSWDPQPRKVSGSWAQAGVAALLNLGGEGSAELTQPGWITCSQGTCPTPTPLFPHMGPSHHMHQGTHSPPPIHNLQCNGCKGSLYRQVACTNNTVPKL